MAGPKNLIHSLLAALSTADYAFPVGTRFYGVGRPRMQIKQSHETNRANFDPCHAPAAQLIASAAAIANSCKS